MAIDEQERLIKELEVALDRLNALYNQYFMGIEKLEPLVPRKDVDRKINALRKMQLRNTALRFRFQAQVQKYSTHASHWQRICRQIEEGTYKRDIMRAKSRVRRAEEAERATQALQQLDADDELSAAVDESASRDGAYDLSGFMDATLDDPFAEPSALPSAASSPRDMVSPVGAGAVDPSSRPQGVPVPARFQATKPVVPVSSKGRQLPDMGEEDFEALSGFFQESTAQAPVSPPRPSAPHSRRPAPPPPPPPPLPSDMRPGRPVPPAPPRPSASSKVRPAAPPPKSSKSASTGLTDDRIQSVYRAYMAARTKTNESTTNITVQKIAQVLRKQAANRGGDVDFQVAIRDGKAVIKTIKK
ncbi:MAG: hypothetical protein GX146_10385 [Myxococcales bacterium]|nr:hypothetical protein [Myxococcales bacterium]